MFALIGLTIISGQASYWGESSDDAAYGWEVDKDHEKSDKKIKDYAAPGTKHQVLCASLDRSLNAHTSILHPSPVIASHTPPPDAAF